MKYLSKRTETDALMSVNELIAKTDIREVKEVSTACVRDRVRGARRSPGARRLWRRPAASPASAAATRRCRAPPCNSKYYSLQCSSADTSNKYTISSNETDQRLSVALNTRGTCRAAE